VQIDPKVYKSLMDGLVQIAKTEGLGSKGLTLGWAPTLIGYSCQGLGKFGFYEYFKDVYGGAIGKPIISLAHQSKARKTR